MIIQTLMKIIKYHQLHRKNLNNFHAKTIKYTKAPPKFSEPFEKD
jgi:hypothetical protein